MREPLATVHIKNNKPRLCGVCYLARYRYNARLPDLPEMPGEPGFAANGLVAQSVEQRIENPCVGGSIPPRATRFRMRKHAKSTRGGIG